MVIALVVVTLGARRVLVGRTLGIVDALVVVVALVNIFLTRRRGRCLLCHLSSSPCSIRLLTAALRRQSLAASRSARFVPRCSAAASTVESQRSEEHTSELQS